MIDFYCMFDQEKIIISNLVLYNEAKQMPQLHYASLYEVGYLARYIRHWELRSNSMVAHGGQNKFTHEN